MTTMAKFALGISLSALTPLMATAQTAVFDTDTTATDAVTATEDAVTDDFERSQDDQRFGPGYRALGWTGSVSASATATSGNSETADLGIGARFGHFDGTNGHDFVLSYALSGDEGERTSNNALLGYDYTRDLDDQLYAFGKLRAAYDEFGSFEEDYFAGAGLGYRVINSGAARWRLQGGPGWRVTKTSDDVWTDEAAALISSKYYYKLSETAFLTNDTDVLYSDSDTLVSNDFGVNVAISGPLAMRTSIRTDYHSDPVDGEAHTDHILGMSLVYTFQ